MDGFLAKVLNVINLLATLPSMEGYKASSFNQNILMRKKCLLSIYAHSSMQYSMIPYHRKPSSFFTMFPSNTQLHSSLPQNSPNATKPKLQPRARAPVQASKELPKKLNRISIRDHLNLASHSSFGQQDPLGVIPRENLYPQLPHYIIEWWESVLEISLDHSYFPTKSELLTMIAIASRLAVFVSKGWITTSFHANLPNLSTVEFLYYP